MGCAVARGQRPLALPTSEGFPNFMAEVLRVNISCYNINKSCWLWSGWKHIRSNYLGHWAWCFWYVLPRFCTAWWNVEVQLGCLLECRSQGQVGELIVASIWRKTQGGEVSWAQLCCDRRTLKGVFQESAGTWGPNCKTLNAKPSTRPIHFSFSESARMSLDHWTCASHRPRFHKASCGSANRLHL